MVCLKGYNDFISIYNCDACNLIYDFYGVAKGSHIIVAFPLLVLHTVLAIKGELQKSVKQQYLTIYLTLIIHACSYNFKSTGWYSVPKYDTPKMLAFL